MKKFISLIIFIFLLVSFTFSQYEIFLYKNSNESYSNYFSLMGMPQFKGYEFYIYEYNIKDPLFGIPFFISDQKVIIKNTVFSSSHFSKDSPLKISYSFPLSSDSLNYMKGFNISIKKENKNFFIDLSSDIENFSFPIYENEFSKKSAFVYSTKKWKNNKLSSIFLFSSFNSPFWFFNEKDVFKIDLQGDAKPNGKLYFFGVSDSLNFKRIKFKIKFIKAKKDVNTQGSKTALATYSFNPLELKISENFLWESTYNYSTLNLNLFYDGFIKIGTNFIAQKSNFLKTKQETIYNDTIKLLPGRVKGEVNFLKFSPFIKYSYKKSSFSTSIKLKGVLRQYKIKGVSDKINSFSPEIRLDLVNEKILKTHLQAGIKSFDKNQMILFYLSPENIQDKLYYKLNGSWEEIQVYKTIFMLGEIKDERLSYIDLQFFKAINNNFHINFGASYSVFTNIVDAAKKENSIFLLKTIKEDKNAGINFTPKIVFYGFFIKSLFKKNHFRAELLISDLNTFGNYNNFYNSILGSQINFSELFKGVNGYDDYFKKEKRLSLGNGLKIRFKTTVKISSRLFIESNFLSEPPVKFFYINLLNKEIIGWKDLERSYFLSVKFNFSIKKNEEIVFEAINIFNSNPTIFYTFNETPLLSPQPFIFKVSFIHY